MELDYLKELLDKQKALDEKASGMTNLANEDALADANIEALNRQRAYLSDERNSLDSEIAQAQAQQEFNAGATAASNEEMLDEIEALGDTPEVEPMMTEGIQAPEGIVFDGGLQSNPDYNRYSDLESLMRGVSVAPVESEPMSTGTPAELPASVEPTQDVEAIQPKIDLIEKIKELKEANPATPLSELMEQAKKEKNQEEANLMYQLGALQLLDVGQRAKTDKSMVLDQLKKVQQSHKDNVAIAVQKDKENQENALNSKNSPITKTMRKIAKQLGIELDADMTAKDLMDSGLKLNTLVGLKSNQDVAMLAQDMKANLNAKKEAVRIEKDVAKLKGENKKYFLDMEQRVGALKRGSSFKDLDTKLNAVAEMRLKLDEARAGKVPINKASGNDLSAVWSKALTGGIPAQGLIEKTLPTSIQSKFAEGVNFLANQPLVNYLSKKNLDLMNDQLEVLERAVNIRKGEKLASVYNSYHQVINADPIFQEIIRRNYGKYVKRNKDGFYTSDKALTESGAETGKKQDSVINSGTEAMIQQVLKNAEKRQLSVTREEAIDLLKRKGKL